MRARTLLLAVAAIATSAAVLHGGPRTPLIVYNPSPSTPVGWYVRAPFPPRIGAFVTLRAQNAAPSYVRARGFADRTDRFIKRVAAVGGQRVCAYGQTLAIDGRFAGRRRRLDGEGRPLPFWEGCRTLGADEMLLLGCGDGSFDGRYWGPTPAADIEAAWTPLGDVQAMNSECISPDSSTHE